MSPINYPDDAPEPGHTNADAVRLEGSTETPQTEPPASPTDPGWSNATASRVPAPAPDPEPGA